MNDDNVTLDLYRDLLTPEETATKKKNPCRLKQWDDAEIGSPVTYIGLDSYYRVASLRRWIAEQERSAGKPEQVRRRPRRPRRTG
jgi:hypothetical protein